MDIKEERRENKKQEKEVGSKESSKKTAHTHTPTGKERKQRRKSGR